MIYYPLHTLYHNLRISLVDGEVDMELGPFDQRAVKKGFGMARARVALSGVIVDEKTGVDLVDRYAEFGDESIKGIRV